ncbi:MAG: hypothetical protein KC561_15890, partial [Myxococcales bacterium]|nr:hypothetical protein [Myxococcales bacterium]
MKISPKVLIFALLTVASSTSALAQPTEPTPYVPDGEVAPTQPQAPVVDPNPGAAFHDQALEAFARRNYEEAVGLIRQAIQAEPTNPVYYRSFARTYYAMGNHDLAVLYYDIYLNQFAEFAASVDNRRTRLAVIQSEREEANSRRTVPGMPPVTPADQVSAVATLRERLTTGP